MKKINKTPSENELTNFQNNNPDDSWDNFRDSDDGKDYKNIRRRIFNNQGGLCAYCECKVSKQPEYTWRVEHYHSKSDQNDTKNWALDWNNIFGVCLGGSDTDQSAHPLPENLSCDSHKDRLIQNNDIPKACEGYFINPLELTATPCLLVFDKSTGEIQPDQNACANWQASINQYPSTYELVKNTIEILNLNCQRLLDERREVLNSYNQQIKRYRLASNIHGFDMLAKQWFDERWPSYFTTRRLLLGKHAEKYLQSITYDG